MIKKILFVIPDLGRGGAEYQTVNMVNCFAKKFDVYLLIFSKEDVLVKYLEIEKENIYFLNSKLNSFSFKKILSLDFLALMDKIYNIFNQKKFDIVLANLPISHFIMRLVLDKGYDFKLINIHRSLQFIANKPNILMKIFMKYNSFLARKYDTLNIFISEASKKDQLRFLDIDEDKTRVIYDGVKLLQVDKIDSISLDRNKFQIVMVGRFVAEKNHQFFVQSMIELIEEKRFSRDISIHFLGDGVLKEEIYNQVKRSGFEDYFVFHGNVSHDVVLRYFKVADLVIIPSKSEGFGNVAVEAGLVGARILSSNIGGLDEVIIDNQSGFKFQSNNKESLKQELLEIINLDKDLDRDKVKEIMIERFSFERMIREYSQEINSIIMV